MFKFQDTLLRFPGLPTPPPSSPAATPVPIPPQSAPAQPLAWQAVATIVAALIGAAGAIIVAILRRGKGKADETEKTSPAGATIGKVETGDKSPVNIKIDIGR